MAQRIVALAQITAILGTALVAGVFFAFSSFVMPALARLPSARGIVAMQSINVVVLNRSFLGVFLGSALCCAGLAVHALLRWSHPGAPLQLAGSALYLVGSLLVTRRCNVPWNELLARLVPEAELAAAAWRRYVAAWSLWNHVRTAASFCAALLLLLALDGCARYGDCAPPDRARLPQLPNELSKTGIGGAGVREFRPQFELWSDGAAKRRFIALPAGSRVDTSDMDNWVFPVGTRLWKELTVDGRRVETRLLQKVGAGAGDWLTQAYLWKADGSEALAIPGGKTDALGTAHDVPSAGECLTCHSGRKSFVLGFSAVQLSYDAEPGSVDLDDLVAQQLVTHAPAARFVVPGDETARAALGYLHANCAHCHNQERPRAAAKRCYDPENSLDFSLKTSDLGSAIAPRAYLSGRGTAFQPGAPADSRMVELMSSRGFLQQMPPLATERVDERGLRAVREWIATLR